MDDRFDDEILPAGVTSPGRSNSPTPQHLEPQIVVKEGGDPNADNVADPNWGKLTGSLRDVMSPLPCRDQMSKWDRIVQERNHRAMEDLHTMAQQAFEFYPKERLKEFIATRVTGHGVPQGYTHESFRLMEHPGEA